MMDGGLGVVVWMSSWCQIPACTRCASLPVNSELKLGYKIVYNKKTTQASIASRVVLYHYDSWITVKPFKSILKMLVRLIFEIIFLCSHLSNSAQQENRLWSGWKVWVQRLRVDIMALLELRPVCQGGDGTACSFAMRFTTNVSILLCDQFDWVRQCYCSVSPSALTVSLRLVWYTIG